MNQSDNPFQAPDAMERPSEKSMDLDDDNYELLRKQHINTEANIKGISSLILLATLFMGFSLFTLTKLKNHPDLLLPDSYINALMVIAAVQGVCLLISGLNLRKLKMLGAKLYAASVVVGLSRIVVDFSTLEIPADLAGEIIGQHIGRMLIPLLVLAFLFGRKARFVYSDEYRLKVIPATPHVKYKSPWLLLLLILIVIVVLVAYASA